MLPIAPTVSAAPAEQQRAAAEYSRRLEQARARHQRLDRLENIVGNARLAVFLAGLVVAFLVIGPLRIAPYWLIVPIVGFLYLVRRHEGIRAGLKRAERTAAYYDKGLARLDDRWAGSGDPGTAFLREEHPYAQDLDLFGTGSLFERISTARTRSGAATLANWLCAPGEPEEIRARQEAVAELSGRLDLREDLALLGAELPGSIDLGVLVEWGEAPAILTSNADRTAAPIVVATGLAALAGWLGQEIGPAPFLIIMLIQTAFAARLKSRVERVVAPVARRAHELALFAGILARLEREPLQSAKLRHLQASLLDSEHASERIRRLMKLVYWLDCRHNQYFALVAPLVLWTTQLAFAFEAWRRGSGPAIRAWLEAVAQLEALASLAAYAYENPDDPFPEIVANGPRFDGEGLGHPLLPTRRCVRNDLRLDGELRVLIVSGSNMSGKSTLLRTAGINAVLAQAGAPVRARRLTLSPLAIGATLRIQDSLQAGKSRFYAEITRMRQLVDLAQGPIPLLFLLDEILHGTNSHDRRLGAEAIVKGLVQRGGIGLVTTHDLALTHIVDQLAPHAANVHFEEHFENGAISFDYLLRPGVVQKSNALELMRAVGLDV